MIEQLSFLEGAPGPVKPRRAAGGRLSADDFAGVRPRDLPESLQLPCILLGLPKVILLISNFGGMNFHVPHAPSDDHPLCRVLGKSAGRLFATHYAGDEIYIPSLAHVRRTLRNRRIRQEYDGGTPIKALVRSEGLSARRIAEILNTPEAP
jgi:hypothetical protein